MRVHKVLIPALLVAVAASGQQRGLENELLSRIREGDLPRVEVLLRSGAGPNTRDETGATALMHAAAFSTPEIVSLLLQAGADPKASNSSGSTALMWATHDSARVRLLLNRGANVNAARPDGVSALVTASLRGKPDVMNMLLAAGADTRGGAVTAPWRMDLTGIGYTTNDDAIRKLLKTAPEPAAMVPPPLTRVMLTSTFSWRPQPAASTASVLRALLEAGADPNETVVQLTLTAPVLSRVVRQRDLEAVRLLIDRGADPNVKGSQGWTPLMMAAATDQNAAVVQLLLDRGAALDARDDAGRTALDWALLQGETDTARILRRAGAAAMAPPAPAPRPVSTPRSIVAALELALSRLQPAGKVFNEKTGCISCHNQSLPSIAVKLAMDKGATVDGEIATHPAAATLKLWDQARENLLLGNCSVFGFLGNVNYGMLALAEEGAPPNAATDAVASCLSGLQKPDGSWETGDPRPPLTGSAIVNTALAVRALKTYAPPGLRAGIASRIVRAREFLRRAQPAGTQDEAFKILGLIWSSAPAGEISAQRRRLLALQREDGGWGQYSSMAPDAYATGQAVYALRAGGVPAGDAGIRRAVQYLLRTQLEDGSWYVRSRTMGFQPYVETGFPHGPDQFISSAATSWAAIALGLTR